MLQVLAIGSLVGAAVIAVVYSAGIIAELRLYRRKRRELHGGRFDPAERRVHPGHPGATQLDPIRRRRRANEGGDRPDIAA